MDSRLQAYRPIASHTTQQVKSSGFLGAGSSPCPGLTTAHTFTATGDLPTCTVNGTLTFPGPDCCDVRAFLDGLLWAYWPGINVGQATELDASGNGHHLTALTGTTITERLDGSGTMWANEAGFSNRGNLFDAIPTTNTNILVTPLGNGYYSATKRNTAISTVLAFYSLTYAPVGKALRADYTARIVLRRLAGVTNTSVDFGFHAGGFSGHTARIISGPGTIINTPLPAVSGLSETIDTVIEVKKTDFEVGVESLTFTIYPGFSGSTTAGDGCIIGEVSLVEGSFPGLLYAPPRTSLARASRSSKGGYPQSLGTVVCIGDSMTAGYIAPITLLHPLTTFANKGVGGDTSAMVLARFAADVVPTADHCIILIGINDITAGETAVAIMANIAACVDIAASNGISVSLSEAPPFGNNVNWTAPKQAVLEELNTLLNTYGVANGIPVASLYDVMRAAGTDDLATAYDSGDGLHFNAAGSATEAWLFGSLLLVTFSATTDLFGYPLTFPGPLGTDATVTEGTAYPAITIQAPLGGDFQVIPEFTGEAVVDLATLAPTPKIRTGPKGTLVYSADLDAAGILRADKVVGA